MFITTVILYAFIGYLLLAIILILFFGLRHRGKIRIESFSTPQKVYWCKLETDKDSKTWVTVIKENPKKNINEWKFEVTNEMFIPYLTRLKRIAYKIMAFPYAPKGIEIDYSNKKLNPYKLTLEDEVRIINAKVVEKAGIEPKEEKSILPLIAVLLSGLTLILLLFQFIGR